MRENFARMVAREFRRMYNSSLELNGINIEDYLRNTDFVDICMLYAGGPNSLEKTISGGVRSLIQLTAPSLLQGRDPAEALALFSDGHPGHRLKQLYDQQPEPLDFGMISRQIIESYKNNNYQPQNLERAVNFLMSEAAIGLFSKFRRAYLFRDAIHELVIDKAIQDTEHAEKLVACFSDERATNILLHETLTLPEGVFVMVSIFYDRRMIEADFLMGMYQTLNPETLVDSMEKIRAEYAKLAEEAIKRNRMEIAKLQAKEP